MDSVSLWCWLDRSYTFSPEHIQYYTQGPQRLQWSGKIQEVAVNWKELEEEKASIGKGNSLHQGWRVYTITMDAPAHLKQVMRFTVSQTVPTHVLRCQETWGITPLHQRWWESVLPAFRHDKCPLTFLFCLIINRHHLWVWSKEEEKERDEKRARDKLYSLGCFCSNVFKNEIDTIAIPEQSFTWQMFCQSHNMCQRSVTALS